MPDAPNYADAWIQYPGFMALSKSKDGPAFIRAFKDAISALPISIGSLQTVIDFESAGRWDPAVKNPASSATGLLQWLESTAQALGTSTARLAKMSASEQMPFARKLFEASKAKLDAVKEPNGFAPVTEVYLAVWGPAFIGAPDATVVGKPGDAVFTQNPFAKENPEELTLGDIRRAVIGHHVSAIQKYGVVEGLAAKAGAGGKGGASGIGVVLGIGILGLLLAKSRSSRG